MSSTPIPISTGEAAGSSSSNLADELAALESLVLDNPELEELEAWLAEFNLFEAIGMVRQEIRHSALLAFLMDPAQPHGLGDHFSTKLLQQATRGEGRHALPVSPLELDYWSLDSAVVQREADNIDVLLLDEVHKFAVIIENKIDSTEHSDQLARYWDVVTRRYSEWRVIGIYLTPEGEQPSHSSFLPLSYRQVANVIVSLLGSRQASLGMDLQILLKHYVQMLERHVMTDTRIAELCRQIYQKHQRALDLILEHRPDRQGTIRDFLERLIVSTEEVELEHSTKSAIRFVLTGADPSVLRRGTDLPSKRILVFEIDNASGYAVRLRLVIRQGDAEIRARLAEMASRLGPPFLATGRKSEKWQTIYSRVLLQASELALPLSEVEQVLSRKWNAFLETDVPIMRERLRAESWMWEV